MVLAPSVFLIDKFIKKSRVKPNLIVNNKSKNNIKS